MTTTANIDRRRRPDLGLLILRRPELGAVAVIAFAWATLVIFAVRGAPSAVRPGMAGMPNMPGMNMSGSDAPHGMISVAGSGLGGWTLMCVAMMGPVAIAGVRHTALNSLRWRRGRAMSEFALAYLAIWTAFGVTVLGIAPVVLRSHGLIAFGIILAAAAIWQVTPFKRRWLRNCHRSVPLPMCGWSAERGAGWFGVRNGFACLGSCWCLMLVMVVAPDGYLVWMLALTGVVSAERLLKRPRRTTRLVAAALGAAAFGVVAVALA